MDDLISRQAAIDALIACKGKDPFNRYEKQNIGLDWGIEALKQLPSAQPEHTNNRVIKQTLDEVYAHAETEAEARFYDEIVRCKECRHRDPEDHKCDCGHDIIWQLPRDDKWYCADAERRTDGV